MDLRKSRNYLIAGTTLQSLGLILADTIAISFVGGIACDSKMGNRESSVMGMGNGQ
jgi:hypothetical protein